MANTTKEQNVVDIVGVSLNRREAINQLIERVNHHRDDLRSQHGHDLGPAQ